MEVYDAIRLRRSIKPHEMKPDPVDPALLERMFEAANWSPSHGHTEPWRFLVYAGEARRGLVEAVLSTMAEGEAPIAASDPRRAKIERNFLTPPLTVALVQAAPSLAKIPPHEDLIAVAIAVQNMMLVARAAEVGTYWTSGEKAFHPKMAAHLGLAPGARCLGFLFVGRPNVPWPEGARRPALEKVSWRG